MDTKSLPVPEGMLQNAPEEHHEDSWNSIPGKPPYPLDFPVLGYAARIHNLARLDLGACFFLTEIAPHRLLQFLLLEVLHWIFCVPFMKCPVLSSDCTSNVSHSAPRCLDGGEPYRGEKFLVGEAGSPVSRVSDVGHWAAAENCVHSGDAADAERVCVMIQCK